MGRGEQEQLSIDWTPKMICYAISVSLSVCLCVCNIFRDHLLALSLIDWVINTPPLEKNPVILSCKILKTFRLFLLVAIDEDQVPALWVLMRRSKPSVIPS